MPASVDSKALTYTLSLLDATLTKSIGGGGVLVNHIFLKWIDPRRPPASRADTLATIIQSPGARNTGHESRTTRRHSLRGLSRNQQVLRKRPLAVDPLAVAPKSRARGHLRNFSGLVLVQAFRPDGFAFVQHEPQARGRNVNRLTPRGTQMHLDPPFRPLPACLVPEAAQIKIRVKLPIDPGQQIQIERRRHASGIVVSQQLQLNVLLQVRAEQQRVSRSQNRSHFAQKLFPGFAVEIADRASQKQYEQMVPV